ncbi:unnamed protein product, partial [Meganyctiphanes norvegica]
MSDQEDTDDAEPADIIITNKQEDGPVPKKRTRDKFSRIRPKGDLLHQLRQYIDSTDDAGTHGPHHEDEGIGEACSYPSSSEQDWNFSDSILNGLHTVDAPSDCRKSVESQPHPRDDDQQPSSASSSDSGQGRSPELFNHQELLIDSPNTECNEKGLNVHLKYENISSQQTKSKIYSELSSYCPVEVSGSGDGAAAAVGCCGGDSSDADVAHQRSLNSPVHHTTTVWLDTDQLPRLDNQTTITIHEKEDATINEAENDRIPSPPRPASHEITLSSLPLASFGEAINQSEHNVPEDEIKSTSSCSACSDGDSYDSFSENDSDADTCIMRRWGYDSETESIEDNIPEISIINAYSANENHKPVAKDSYEEDIGTCLGCFVEGESDLKYPSLCSESKCASIDSDIWHPQVITWERAPSTVSSDSDFEDNSDDDSEDSEIYSYDNLAKRTFDSLEFLPTYISKRENRELFRHPSIHEYPAENHHPTDINYSLEEFHNPLTSVYLPTNNISSSQPVPNFLYGYLEHPSKSTFDPKLIYKNSYTPNVATHQDVHSQDVICNDNISKNISNFDVNSFSTHNTKSDVTRTNINQTGYIATNVCKNESNEVNISNKDNILTNIESNTISSSQPVPNFLYGYLQHPSKSTFDPKLLYKNSYTTNVATHQDVHSKDVVCNDNSSKNISNFDVNNFSTHKKNSDVTITDINQTGYIATNICKNETNEVNRSNKGNISTNIESDGCSNKTSTNINIYSTKEGFKNTSMIHSSLSPDKEVLHDNSFENGDKLSNCNLSNSVAIEHPNSVHLLSASNLSENYICNEIYSSGQELPSIPQTIVKEKLLNSSQTIDHNFTYDHKQASNLYDYSINSVADLINYNQTNYNLQSQLQNGISENKILSVPSSFSVDNGLQKKIFPLHYQSLKDLPNTPEVHMSALKKEENKNSIEEVKQMLNDITTIQNDSKKITNKNKRRGTSKSAYRKLITPSNIMEKPHLPLKIIRSDMSFRAPFRIPSSTKRFSVTPPSELKSPWNHISNVPASCISHTLCSQYPVYRKIQEALSKSSSLIFNSALRKLTGSQIEDENINLSKSTDVKQLNITKDIQSLNEPNYNSSYNKVQKDPITKPPGPIYENIDVTNWNEICYKTNIPTDEQYILGIKDSSQIHKEMVNAHQLQHDVQSNISKINSNGLCRKVEGKEGIYISKTSILNDFRNPLIMESSINKIDVMELPNREPPDGTATPEPPESWKSKEAIKNNVDKAIHRKTQDIKTVVTKNRDNILKNIKPYKKIHDNASLNNLPDSHIQKEQFLRVKPESDFHKTQSFGNVHGANDIDFTSQSVPNDLIVNDNAPSSLSESRPANRSSIYLDVEPATESSSMSLVDLMKLGHYEGNIKLPIAFRPAPSTSTNNVDRKDNTNQPTLEEGTQEGADVCISTQVRVSLKKYCKRRKDGTRKLVIKLTLCL